MKKFLTKTTIIGTLILLGINFNTQVQASIFSNKNSKIIEINEDFKLVKPISYVWVNPYTRSNGTSVRGHYRTSPDGYCFNNLSGC